MLANLGCLSVYAQACTDGNIKNNFKNLEITKACSIFSDYVQLKPGIDHAIKHQSKELHETRPPYSYATRLKFSQFCFIL